MDDADDDSMHDTHPDVMEKEDIGKLLDLVLEGEPSISSDVKSRLLDASVFVLKAIIASDPYADAREFQRTKHAVFKGLQTRKVWRLVPKSEVPVVANILGGHLLLSTRTLAGQTRKKWFRISHKDRKKIKRVYRA